MTSCNYSESVTASLTLEQGTGNSHTIDLDSSILEQPVRVILNGRQKTAGKFLIPLILITLYCIYKLVRTGEDIVSNDNVRSSTTSRISPIEMEINASASEHRDAYLEFFVVPSNETSVDIHQLWDDYPLGIPQTGIRKDPETNQPVERGRIEKIGGITSFMRGVSGGFNKNRQKVCLPVGPEDCIDLAHVFLQLNFH